MLGAGMDAQLGELLLRQWAFAWHHALHSEFDSTLWKAATEDLAGRGRLDAAWITGVTIVCLITQFVARETSLFCIDNNDMVASIDVWCEISAMLAAKPFCDI